MKIELYNTYFYKQEAVVKIFFLFYISEFIILQYKGVNHQKKNKCKFPPLKKKIEHQLLG